MAEVLIRSNASSESLPYRNLDRTDRIVQNIRNILNTYKYEVAYNRDLGISPDIIDKDSETIKSMIMSDLFDNIKKYEPRATLKAVDITEISTDGKITATIKIEV